MVYDPIHGCVRGRCRLHPPIVLTDEDKRSILDAIEAKKKPMDRVEQVEELAQVSFPQQIVNDWAERVNDEEWGKLLHIQPTQVKRGRLRFMIGLQRSGKSTWATNWSRQTPRKDSDGIVYPRAIVCADNIRLAISGERYNKHIEPITFMVKDYMIEALLSRGHDVLVDGTHTTKFSIRQVLKIDPDATYTFINTPVDECKRRAVATNQPDLVPVLDRTGRQLAALLDEGISQVCDQIRQEMKSRYEK